MSEALRGEKVQVKCRCGQLFWARVADRKRGWGKFCSKSCKAIRQVQTHGRYPASKDSDEIDDYYDGSWDEHQAPGATRAPDYMTVDDL